MTDEQLYLLVVAMGDRRAAEAQARLDVTIAAVATALSPKALEAWADRQRRGQAAEPATYEERVAARDRMLRKLGGMFPGMVT